MEVQAVQPLRRREPAQLSPHRLQRLKFAETTLAVEVVPLEGSLVRLGQLAEQIAFGRAPVAI